jgi:hypothetical protein
MSRNDSIVSRGLELHLSSTRHIHKGKKYEDLIDMLENKASHLYMARAFGVNKNTIYKWLAIYRDEQRREQPKES